MIMQYSNLSKIKPKLRTTGNITGNFGRPKSKAGSTLSGIGVTNAETVKCMTGQELTHVYLYDKLGNRICFQKYLFTLKP